MNKIYKLILIIQALFVTTAVWGYNITFKINDANRGSIFAVLPSDTETPVTSADGNQAVRLKVTPNHGYILNSENLKIRVYADPGRADSRTDPGVMDIISFSAVSGVKNTYEFTMPNYDVEVEAVFTDANDFSESAVIVLQEDTREINTTSYSDVFDWTAHTPTVKSVMIDDTPLIEGTDYTVSKESSITQTNDTYTITNVGETITFTFNGIGLYKGTKVITYTITPLSIANAGVTLSTGSTTVYNLSEQKPTLTVTLSGHTLSETTNPTDDSPTGDFIITYPTDMTNAGTKTLVVTGINNFKDNVSTNPTYTITPKDMSDLVVTLDIPAEGYTYDGTAKTPAVAVRTSGGISVSTEDYDVTYTDNVVAGDNSAKVTVTGKRNYTGSIVTTFTISQNSIEPGSFTVTFTDGTTAKNLTYNGTEQEPGIIVKSGDTTLDQGTHYAIAYTANKNVGEATITVTGIGNYSGTKAIKFNIQPKPLDASMVSLSATSYTYNGNVQIPTVTVTDNQTIGGVSTSIITPSDYDISNPDHIDAGGYSVVVTGQGNYTGSVDKAFTIAPQNLSSAVVTLAQTEYEYSGTAYTPAVSLVTVATTTVGTITVPSSGYNIGYSNNTDAGTATVTVTGSGNFTGSVNKTFTITRKPVTNAMIVFDEENFVYDGTAKVPNVTVKDGTKTLLNTDYTIVIDNATEVGTYNVVITGVGNYQDTASRQFSIVAKDANTKFTVELGYATTIFDGSNKTPTVTVKEGSTTLAVNTDYTVSFSNNRNVGTATVTVTGKGHYAGTKTATFAITKKALADDMLTLSSTSFTFNGTNQKPVATITDGGIIAESDYTLTNAGGVNAGTYHVVVAATSAGNYSGSIDKTFTIGQLDIASATLTLNTLDSYVYDGLVKEPGVKEIKFSDGLIVSADGYSVAYSNNLNIGEATVTVTGKVNYTGTKTASFTITPQPITEEMILLSNEQYVYNGNLQKPDVIVMSGATTLTQDVDYTLENDGGTAVGVYQVKVTGKGNYIDTATKRYRIVDQIAYSFDVEMSTESVVYNGTAQEPKVVVKDGKKTLEVGTHYTLVYTNNVNVGTASVIITGQGDYTGTKTMSFLIKPKALTEEMVSLDKTEFVYNAMTQRPAVTVKDGTALTANDYVLTNSGGTDVGTYDVIVTGRNNYSGSIKRQFKITPLSLAEANVILNELPNYEYDGRAKDPGVREVIIGTIVVPQTYYTYSISSNVNAGVVTVSVTGKDNYTGSASTTFAIKPKHLTEEMVTLLATVIKYTGTAQKPPVKVVDGTKTLSERVDYRLIGDGGIEVGDYEIIIGGIGNYTDSITRKYSIQYDGIPIDVPVIDDDKKETKVEFFFVPTGPNSNEVEVAGVILPEDMQSSTFGVTIPATCTNGDNTYTVVGIADDAFKGMKNLRDVWMPETEEPMTIGENALPPSTVVHTPLSLLADYALMPSLEDNFISGNVKATVKTLSRYWTFSSGVDVIIPNGLKTFMVCERSNNSVSITEIAEEELMIGGQRIVKSNNGVMFACVGNDSIYDFVASAKRMRSGTTVSLDDHKDYGKENCLVPVIRATHFESGYYYFLKNNEFHRIKTESEEIKVPAGKAVLYLGSSASTRSSVIGIEGEGTTGLRFMNTDDDNDIAPWYDMSGRRLSGTPTQKGVYIHNHKKVIIR